VTVVITGFHPAGYAEYAHRFFKTFEKHWPADVRLVAYVEEPIRIARAETVSAWECWGLQKFLDRYAQHTGRGSNGYDFRRDAVKWCKQLFFPEHAAANLPDGEVVAWFDADVIFDHDVPPGLVEGLLGEDADLCYLGRAPYHSELGFWAVRLNRHTRLLLTALADAYREAHVFRLREWHSAYVFDHCRTLFSGTLSYRNLTPGGKGHVWFESPLGAFSDHLKGRRKALGRSPERPIP
jgi:hypothetical protein